MSLLQCYHIQLMFINHCEHYLAPWRRLAQFSGSRHPFVDVEHCQSRPDGKVLGRGRVKPTAEAMDLNDHKAGALKFPQIPCPSPLP